MCLILLAWQADPAYPLVIAANRDEFHARPSAPAQRWREFSCVIGGRDLEAGGTWLGITDTGRFAAITNVREPGMPLGKHSRGALPREFLAGKMSAGEYASQINVADFSGFNLLIGDGNTAVYCSNRCDEPHLLAPGVYGLSNHRLDTPWPKLIKARTAFREGLQALPDTEPLFALLTDDEIVPDVELPQTGVSLEWERRLSAIFVKSPDYGTRASTVVWQNKAGAYLFEERSFDPAGELTQSSRISTDV